MDLVSELHNIRFDSQVNLSGSMDIFLMQKIVYDTVNACKIDIMVAILMQIRLQHAFRIIETHLLNNSHFTMLF